MGNMTTSALRNTQTSFDLGKTFPPEVIMLKILTRIPSPESDAGIFKDYIQKYSCSGDKP